MSAPTPEMQQVIAALHRAREPIAEPPPVGDIGAALEEVLGADAP